MSVAGQPELTPQKKTILVLYNLRHVYPVVQSILTHLYCFRQYSRHHIVYVNVAFGWPEELLKDLHIDAVLFHTRFLGRWNPEKFLAMLQWCEPLKQRNCFKMAMPQDEFINTQVLNEFIEDFQVHRILTCADAPDWHTIYDQVDTNRVSFETVLTGYIDPELVKSVSKYAHPYANRDIDIAYRAWRAEPWLGRHGQHKVKVAEAVSAHALARSLNLDISLNSKDTIKGMAWFEFLGRAKATIGVEGGASVLDKEGRIREAVYKYQEAHPDADYDEVEAACFPHAEGQIHLACISPRHLEACMTKTCQLLIEGNYNGILKPWQHYVPIQPDYSNLDEVLAMFEEPDKLQAIADRAYADVVESGQCSYPAFVAHLDETVTRECERLSIPAAEASPAHLTALERLAHRDEKTWAVIQAEMQYHQNKRPFYKKLFYKSRFQWSLHQLQQL